MFGRTLLLVSILAILEGVVAYLLGGPAVAISMGLGMLLAVHVIWRMPCGKAGIMVLAGAISLIYLSSVRGVIGEAGFWFLLLWSIALLFYTYKRAALDGESSCGTVCPIDVES